MFELEDTMSDPFSKEQSYIFSRYTSLIKDERMIDKDKYFSPSLGMPGSVITAF